MDVEATTIIERSVAIVWDFYAVHQVQNHPRWDPDMSLEQVTSGPIGVGTVIRRRTTRFGTPIEGTMEIVEFDPLRAMGAKIRDGQTEMSGRATFTVEDRNRTRLTMHVELPGADQSMAEKLAPLVQRSADTIRRLIESEPDG
ncbi:SRPBCC family protein [Agromyces sp. Soil535]|uniref:SRPBCC family protein n=1 Tax=Agromyces sp. Soil535 TaxID=1736390 RepID=UPI0006FF344C|nr:SRPBCC family protein [Agromyces sp. Soil535]KRE30982.1 hypothetical protein ASG80_00285 [Agromyces sp. Soil535]